MELEGLVKRNSLNSRSPKNSCMSTFKDNIFQHIIDSCVIFRSSSGKARLKNLNY